MSDAQLHPYVNVWLYDHPKKTSAPQKKATLKRQEENLPTLSKVFDFEEVGILRRGPSHCKRWPYIY